MKKNISRRSFLKLFGAGSVATAATLAGCKDANKAGSQAKEEYKNQVEPPVGQMTYRINPKNKDKVSILGYGMMRLPSKVVRESRSVAQVLPLVATSVANIMLLPSSLTSTTTFGHSRSRRECILTL